MNQLTIFDVPDIISRSDKEVSLPDFRQKKEDVSTEVSTSTLDILSWAQKQSINFHFDNFHWYKIELLNWKIRRIYFKMWEQSYLANVEYDYHIKKHLVRNFYSQEDDSEIKEFILKNFRILSLQKKDNVWYWWVNKPEYSKNIWLNYQKVSKFSEKLIENFHINI